MEKSLTVAEIGYPRKMRLSDVLPEKMGLDLRVPARTIPMGRRSVTGRVIVRGKAIGCESNLEHDFLVRLAMDPTVADVLEQPVTIPYVDIKGRRSRYTPDFLVRYICGNQTLWEVKFSDEIKTERRRLKARLVAGRSFAAEHGLRFRLITERLIRAPDFKNLTFLRGFVENREEPVVETAILAAIRREGASTPRQAIDAAFSNDADRQAAIAPLWRLVANGIVIADLMSPLTMTSPISARDP